MTQPVSDLPVEPAAQPEEEPPPVSAKPPPMWERREQLRIHRDMAEVIKTTIKISQMQVDQLRRKLEKLQYGS